MPLKDIDIYRRRCSTGLPVDKIDVILYIYNESLLEEKHYQSVHELVNFLEVDMKNSNTTKENNYWIEFFNDSSVDLPNSIQILCEYFDIHPLTLEDITTLAPYMALNLFHDTGSLHLVMKILTWNGEHIEQQQISFYLKSSHNVLITFQNKCINHVEPFFQLIRNRLRRQQQHKENIHDQKQLNNHLRQLNVDYLFYCLLDTIIDRYMSVMESISDRISQFDEILMSNSKSRTLETLHSIYTLKHDLIHLRILLNPLKEIITRLQRTTSDNQFLIYPRQKQAIRLGMRHRLVRHPTTTIYRTPSNDILKTTEFKSIYFNEYIYVYFNDLNNHAIALIDSLEVQRESVLILISFWLTLNSNETQRILETLMLITVLFMPCNLLNGINSTNLHVQPQLEYHYGYYIVLSVLALIFFSMITWYKTKHWI